MRGAGKEEETNLGGAGCTLGGPRRNRMVFGGQLWSLTTSVFTSSHDLQAYRVTAHTKVIAMANQQGEAGEQRAGRNENHPHNRHIKAQERAGKKAQPDRRLVGIPPATIWFDGSCW